VKLQLILCIAILIHPAGHKVSKPLCPLDQKLTVTSSGYHLSLFCCKLIHHGYFHEKFLHFHIPVIIHMILKVITHLILNASRKIIIHIICYLACICHFHVFDVAHLHSQRKSCSLIVHSLHLCLIDTKSSVFSILLYILQTEHKQLAVHHIKSFLKSYSRKPWGNRTPANEYNPYVFSSNEFYDLLPHCVHIPP